MGSIKKSLRKLLTRSTPPATATAWLAGVGTVAVAAAFMGCASSQPHVFGAYRDLGPKVAPTKGERLPAHVTVQVAQGANVAVFLVVPGGTTRLLFPADSAQSAYVETGSHLVETSLARADTSRRVQRPGVTQGRGPVSGMPNQGGRGTGRGMIRQDSIPMLGGNLRGYLMIYASKQPLTYSALAARVAGLSVPIDDNDALNTVTKLVRDATHTTGTWAAYATDFPP